MLHTPVMTQITHWLSHVHLDTIADHSDHRQRHRTYIHLGNKIHTTSILQLMMPQIMLHLTYDPGQ